MLTQYIAHIVCHAVSQSQYRLKEASFASVPQFTVAEKYRLSIGAKRKQLQTSTIMLNRDVAAVAEKHAAKPLVLPLKGDTVQSLQRSGMCKCYI
jgi:hypothetical protein